MYGVVCTENFITYMYNTSIIAGNRKALIKLKHTYYAFFGEMAMCGEGDERSATVRAETECVLAELSAAQIKGVVEKNPEFGAKFYQNLSAVLADRLRKSNRDVLKLTTALTLALEE